MGQSSQWRLPREIRGLIYSHQAPLGSKQQQCGGVRRQQGAWVANEGTTWGGGRPSGTLSPNIVNWQEVDLPPAASGTVHQNERKLTLVLPERRGASERTLHPSFQLGGTQRLGAVCHLRRVVSPESCWVALGSWQVLGVTHVELKKNSRWFPPTWLLLGSQGGVREEICIDLPEQTSSY